MAADPSGSSTGASSSSVPASVGGIRPDALESNISDEVVEFTPQEGFVMLDLGPSARPWLFVHKLTLKAHKLPLGQWELIYDEQGLGALLDSSGARVDPLMIEDVMNRTSLNCADGMAEYEILSNGALKYRAFSSYTRQQHECTATFGVGAKGRSTPFGFFRLMWPRQGLHSLLCGTDVHRLLKLKAYQHIQSQWLSRSVDGWRKYLLTPGIDSGNLVGSTQAKKASGDDQLLLRRCWAVGRSQQILV